MNCAIFWLHVRTSNPSTFSMMKSRVQSASSNFCPQVMSQDVQGELEWCIDVMILFQVVEIRRILTSFGVGGHCLMASGKLMKFAFFQSLSTWTEDVGGMGIPTMDNDKEPRYAQMGKEKLIFRECPFWSKAAQSAREGHVKYRQVHQVQWKNEWQEHLREAMTLLKSGYGESLLWPELPQRGSTMSARTFTFGISWHILSSMALRFFFPLPGWMPCTRISVRAMMPTSNANAVMGVRVKNKWGTRMKRDATWCSHVNLLDITPKMWTAQLERPSQSFWHNVFDFQRMPGLTAMQAVFCQVWSVFQPGLGLGSLGVDNVDMTLWNQSLCFFCCWQWSCCWMRVVSCGIAPQSQIFAVAQLHEPELGWNHGRFYGPCCGTTPKKNGLDGFAIRKFWNGRSRSKWMCLVIESPLFWQRSQQALVPLLRPGSSRIQISLICALNPQLGTASDACMGTRSSAEVLGRYVLMVSTGICP